LKVFITTITTFLNRVCDKLGFIDIIYYAGTTVFKAHDGDAGYDLYAFTSVVIPPFTEKEVQVNTILSSRRLWFLLVSRSSTLRNYGLLVSTAIIDNGYRGEMHLSVYNTTDKEVHINYNDRLGQVIPFKLIKAKVMFGLLPSRDGRGAGGFGSSGR